MNQRFAAALALLSMLVVAPVLAHAGALSVPQDQRGAISAERMGTHDANNIRTRFWNYGMVGDFVGSNVDLSVFHSVEVPKGSGMNYSDGITPFVLERYHARGSLSMPPDLANYTYIMETGYRERQGFDAQGHMMRFEPRPGFFEPDPTLNTGRSPAMSHDPRTWPHRWPDKISDPDDPGWVGSWDGYFGKRPAADQESFTVMDDQYYSTQPIFSDTTDASRRGLALRVEVRGFQWSNPQAGNVIFWHYDISNESTTDYPDAIFGLYMDSGVGGSAYSECDQVFESDDDIAFFNQAQNLVYTWDYHGTGVDLNGTCQRTGYLGYSYLETPGNPYDHVDNDLDGITDERRDSGPGTHIVGQDAIRAYVYAHYDTTNFFRVYGRLENRPAFKAATWWTGDEDMDWNPAVDDVGADGVAAGTIGADGNPATADTGEGDGIPTEGEPNFDRTDLHESDQIGLTGFKLNRISKIGVAPTDWDHITFTNVDGVDSPHVLYDYFTDPVSANRYDLRDATDWNIAFLFASGPFALLQGQHERFSLALAFGATLPELREAVNTVQIIYNANYQFAVPPKRPTVSAEAGDGRVTLTWDNLAERSIDPVIFNQDFEGYRIYRSTDPDFLDPQRITNGLGTGPLGNGTPIAQFDLVDQVEGWSRLSVSGVKYWLGTDTGIRHTWTDTTVTNGQQYYYAVCAYDFGYDTGVDSTSFYPSENSIPVSRTLRGGLILPSNVVAVQPEPRIPGWVPATVANVSHAFGRGAGTLTVGVTNSALVPQNHLFAIGFLGPPDSVLATSYYMRDSTTHQLMFDQGTDFTGQGIGPTAVGLLPFVSVPQLQYVVGVDSVGTKWRTGSSTNVKLTVNVGFVPDVPANLRRPHYPYDISVVFYDTVVDTGISPSNLAPKPLFMKPAKFHVYSREPDGDHLLKFDFRDDNNNGVPDAPGDRIDVFTYSNAAGIDSLQPQHTWQFKVDPTSPPSATAILPHAGDTYDMVFSGPANFTDIFTFTTSAQSFSSAQAHAGWSQKPYVVPNPYVDEASFEPQRYASSGRGDRRVEFRAVPLGAVIRIYTVHGDLVRTLRQNGSTVGEVPWDLRTKDNLDVAPGLYVYHVDAPGLGTYLGKFAVIK